MRLFALFLSTLLVSGNAQADQRPPRLQDGKRLEKLATEILGRRLLILNGSTEMKEATHPESLTGGGQQVDKDTGNTFVGLMTYHPELEATCLEWLGDSNQVCQRWLDPGIAKHGLEGPGGDASPLEALVAEEWQAAEKVDQGSNYKIWDIIRDPAAGPFNTDANGKFRKDGLISMKLKSKVKRRIDDLGARSADRTLNAFSKKKNQLPNEIDTRLLASRYSKFLRNRMLANIGGLRAADPGTEFLLSEENPDCENYVRAARGPNSPDQQRLYNQGPLEPETPDLVSRFNRCKALRAASAYLVNAQMQGNTVRAGSKETENMFKWRSRLGLIAMDFAGIDLNKVPKPSNAQLSRDEVANMITDHDQGGVKIKSRRMMTNAQQLQAYNRSLDQAAISNQIVSERSPGFVDNSVAIRSNKIRPGSKRIDQINGLTKQMALTLKETTFGRVSRDMPRGSGRGPASEPELRPSKLTVTK